MQVTIRSGRKFMSGTLTGTSLVIPMDGAPLPATITLKSAEAGCKIELSTDDGVEYFQPIYDAGSATMLVVSISAPVSHVKFTAAIADTWSVR